MMLRRYSRNCGYKGLTLIEVIASIALLSSLLVFTLSIHARHVRQITLADQRRQSGDLLDDLLAQWFSADEPFPVNQNGVFEQNPEFRWVATDLRSTATNLNWKTKIVRVEVFANDTSEKLVSVDLVDELPLPNREGR